MKCNARGLSLLELLVAMALSLGVCMAAVSLYQGAALQAGEAVSASRLNDDGQAALDLLRQHVEMAGYNPPRTNRPLDSARNAVWAADAAVVRGCDGLPAGSSPGVMSSWKCPAVSGTSADALAVRYEADAYNTWPTTQGEPTQCLGGRLDPLTVSAMVFNALGQPQSTSVTTYVAEHLFYVAPASRTGIRTLYCRPSNGTAQPLLENVEDLQVLYGTGSVQDGEPVALAFATATELDRLGASAWASVRAIRVCLVVRSAQAAVGPQGPQYGCAGAPIANSDRRMRRLYQATWVLRNRMWS